MPIISLCRLSEWVKVFNDTFCIVHPALTREYLLQTATNVSCLSEAISGPFFIYDLSDKR
jgi:hypothetical protein